LQFEKKNQIKYGSFIRVGKHFVDTEISGVS